jgi:glycosyltransferase involved in cell wall biosynthesis
MDRERYQPAVFVWDRKDMEPYGTRIRALGIPLYSFPGDLSGVLKLRAFRRFVFEHKPEVVHSYSFYTNFAAWWAALGKKTIAVGSVRGDFAIEKKSSGILLGRLSARWPRTQIYNNFVGAKVARPSYSLFTSRQVLVVRNALDLRQFRMAPVSTNGRTHIVGVGSLIQIKRWDRLLRAAAVLKGNGLDFRVEITGGGPLRESLEKQARDLGLSDRVRFAGHTDDVSTSLAGSTFLAHTSDTEGCPNVVMEAMACGRAVVATDAGDIPSLVEDGKTGFVVRRGDEEALMDRMAMLIADRDMCRRMGEAGRAKAEREFGLERLTEETLAVYRSAGWKD